ncbi:sensor histidine kinase [Oceanobacter mangrovi]|uniref:sensor histidine kinase n=1 Tax=Oceanobacter mangrovi TaxID=2862510 RepID=UPI001C8EC0DC|nr:PAS domain S-box protein [Oceanobacter mangrovi]
MALFQRDFHHSIGFKLTAGFVLVALLSAAGFHLVSDAVHDDGHKLLLTIMLGVGSNLVIVAVVMYLFIYPQIIRRLNSLNKSIRAITGGNLRRSINAHGDDEITAFERTLELFRQELISREKIRKDALLGQQKLQVILDGAVDGIVLIDERGTINSFNRTCERLFQYSAEEMIGKNVSVLMPRHTAKEHDGYLSNYLQTGHKRMIGTAREVVAIRKDGKTLPVRLSVREIIIDDKRLYCGVLEDMEERNEAEKRYAYIQKFQQLIMSNIPDLLFVKDSEFRIVNANPAFLAVYPESIRHTVIGSTTLESYQPEEREAFLVFDRKALAEGYSENEEVIQFPDGKSRALQTKKVRFYNSQGEAFILGLSRDITAIKEAEDSLRKANSELEEFAYRTSHDLRSPLVSAISLLGMARESIEDGDTEIAVESIKHAEASLGNLEHLVKSILSLTETKHVSEDATDIDLDRLLGSAIKHLNHMEGFQRIDIRIHNNATHVVKTLRGRLLLIIENLLSNAIKYQDPQESNPSITIQITTPGDRLIISIEDNGLGIPESQRSHLFQMFKRFHRRVSFGSGLGLYMVRKSAEILGGELSFEAPEKGARFVLNIPLKPEERLP